MFTKPIHFYPLGEVQLLLTTATDIVSLAPSFGFPPYPENTKRTSAYLGLANNRQNRKTGTWWGEFPSDIFVQ